MNTSNTVPATSVPKYSIVSWFISLGVFLAIVFISTTVWAAGENITTPSNKTSVAGNSVDITDLQVTGDGNEEVSLVISANAGVFNVGVTTDITLTGNDTNTITIVGLREDVNTALASLSYTSTGLGADTITVDFGTTLTGVIVDPDTGRAYTIIEDPLNWNDATVAAALLEYGGVSGYLANITSADEDQFIASQLSDNVWIGASDIDTEGDWQWYGGPEVGISFWSGDGLGSAVGGAYSNWNLSEPNDSFPGEDCAEYIIGSGWNDLPCNITKNYIVEFGAGAELPDPITTSFTITTTGPEVAIASCEELQAIDDSEGNRFASINLTQDIDCSGVENFAPLMWGDPFVGTVDGQGFTISNVTIEGVDTQGYGLFGYVRDAHFEDLTIDNINITVTEDSRDCGALVGGAQDTSLSNVTIKNADITCMDVVGGVFGYLALNESENIDIMNVSVVGGSVNADMNDNGERAGGIFGYVSVYTSAVLTIEEVYTDIEVLARVSQAGGLFGSIDSLNDDSNNPDSIFTLRNAYVKGDVRAVVSDHSGGIAGDLGVENNGDNSVARAIFENIYVSGDVSAVSEVGGFIGDVLTLEDDDERVEVRNSFFSGVVTGFNPDETHALFGDDNFLDGGTFTMDGVYFDQMNSGQSLGMFIEDYPGIVAVNTDGSQPDYFIGNNTNAPMNAWDFEDIWVVVADSTPIFKAPLEPEEPSQESENPSTPSENSNNTPVSNNTSENTNSTPAPLPISQIISPIISNIRRVLVDAVSNIVTPSSTDESTRDSGDPIANFYATLLLNEPSLRGGENHVESFNSELVIAPNQTGLLVKDFTPEDSSLINRKLGIAIEIPRNIASDTLTFNVELKDGVDVQNIGEEEVKKIGSLFKVTARDSQGNLVTKFDSPITISLFVLDNLRGRNNINVYYLSDGSTEWQQIQNPEFSQAYVTFSVDHLTMFGIFEGEDIPSALPATLANEDTSSPSMWWIWILILLVVLILFFLIIKNRKKKTPHTFVN